MINHLPNLLENNFNKASSKFVTLPTDKKYKCGLKNAVNSIKTYNGTSQ